jgi:hypothetical protein
VQGSILPPRDRNQSRLGSARRTRDIAHAGGIEDVPDAAVNVTTGGKEVADEDPGGLFAQFALRCLPRLMKSWPLTRPDRAPPL